MRSCEYTKQASLGNACEYVTFVSCEFGSSFFMRVWNVPFHASMGNQHASMVIQGDHASMKSIFMRVSMPNHASMEFKIPCEYEAGPCEYHVPCEYHPESALRVLYRQFVPCEF